MERVTGLAPRFLYIYTLFIILTANLGVVGITTSDMKKNMMKLAVIASLLTVFTTEANAQVQRSEWTVGPIITTTNPAYSGAAMVAESAIAAI